MTTIKVVFFNLGHFIPVFEKGQGRPPSSPSPSLFTRLSIAFYSQYSQSSSFAGEGRWNGNLWKGQGAEISYKIYMIFLPFVNLHNVQKNEQAKLYS